MNPEQKKLLRDALLAALVTAAPLSLPAATLMGAARAAGFRLTPDELAREIDYLVKGGYASQKSEKLSAGAIRWESTAAATEYCEENALV